MSLGLYVFNLYDFSRDKSIEKTTAKIIMAGKLFGICLILVHFWAHSHAHNEGDTLVLVDNLAIRETHSIFFRGLQGKKNR